MHQFGIIKKCFDTVDARCKNEDLKVHVQRKLILGFKLCHGRCSRTSRRSGL